MDNTKQSDRQQREVPPEFVILRTVWRRYRTSWRTFHYVLGVATTTATILIASRPTSLEGYPIIYEVLSIFSVFGIATISFLLPSRHAKVYSDAWRILNNACLRYTYDPEADIEILFEAVAKGEELVRTSDPA